MAACSKVQDPSYCRQEIANQAKEITRVSVENKIEALEAGVDKSCWQTEYFKMQKVDYLVMQGKFLAAQTLMDSFDLQTTKFRQRIRLTQFAIVFDGSREFDPGDRRAFEYANDLILSFPQSFEGFMLRGAVFARSDKFDASIADYITARTLVKPADMKLFEAMEIYYAGLFYNHGRHATSFRIIRSRLDEHPEAWSNSGMVLRAITSALVLKHNEDAAKLFRELLRRNPSAKGDKIFVSTVENLRFGKAMDAKELDALTR